jgi:uncharacterized damage-inducible protein DinB
MQQQQQALRIYDYLVRSRERVLSKVRTLSGEQYSREFAIGLGNLSRTLAHILSSEWYYMQRMLERDVPAYETWPIRPEDPPPFAKLEHAWRAQTEQTLAGLRAVKDWSRAIEYRVVDDDGCAKIVTASAADLFTQLALHEVHHRAQALNMLRQIGIVITDDLDFNAMMFTRRDGHKS